MKKLFIAVIFLCLITSTASCSKKDNPAADTTGIATLRDTLPDTGTASSEIPDFTEPVVIDTESITIAVTESTAPDTTETESETTVHTGEDSSEAEPPESDSIPTETSEIIITTMPDPEPTYKMEDFDGWWYHIGEKISGSTPVVEVIHIDGKTGTWTEYSKYGVPGKTYTCEPYLNGISLDYGDVGVTLLAFDGISLLNFFGYIEYIPGDPIEKVDTKMYEGKWYEFGDTGSDYYEITKDSFTLYENGKSSANGTWKTENVTRTTEGGTELNEIVIDLASSGRFIVADKGNALYDKETNTAYIHERAIGNINGDNLTKKYDLICHKWAGPTENDPTVVFEYDDDRFYLETNGNSGTTRKVGGTWSIFQYELSLHYIDGHEEITPYEPDIMRFSYYNMSFTKIN